jgi:hypothetical protein
VQEQDGRAKGGGEGEVARWRGAQERTLTAAQESGKLKAKLVDRGLDLGKQVGPWEEFRCRDMQAVAGLRVAIARAAQALGAEEKLALAEWGDKITPTDTLDLPEGILGDWRGFEQESLQDLKYVVRCMQQPSAPLRQTAAQRDPPEGFRPRTTEELFMPWAWKVLQAWIAEQLVFLRDIRKGGAKAERRSNETLALGSNALVEGARGILWDCRGPRPVPLDVQHVESSHINFDLLVKEGREWGVDHELTDMFEFGFSYKADLEMQVVGCPHLVSLRENYTRLVEDTRNATLGDKTSKFFEISQQIPFVPCRFGSKGSAAKDGYYLDGTPKRRPTNEGGAPRKPTKDTDGIPVRPINVATEETLPHAKETPFPKWAHENKPWMSDLMIALVILMHLAWRMGEGAALYVFGDDCASFFNQFRTRTAQWPFTIFLIDDEEGRAEFVLEKGMNFGPSKASQLAQRIANFVMEMFYRRMDTCTCKVDAPFVEAEAERNPGLKAWLKARGTEVDGKWQWTVQCRLYAALMYTDDPVFVGLGADRTVRMLLVWERLTRELGLIMNREKRNLGTHLVWLGFGILATPGMLYVTKKKVVKLAAQISAAVDGTLELGGYRSMMGSLEHILFATNRDRQLMLGLWRPLRGSWEPNDRVRLSPDQKERLRGWMSFVVGVGGVSALRAVAETLEQRVGGAAQVFTVTSDAYSESGGQGLGVYMHGLYAWYDVPKHLQGLHITALEFLAGLLAIKLVGTIVAAAEGQVLLHMRLDAITACYSLTEKSEKSRALQAVHQVLLQMPEYMEIQRWIAVSHIAGPSNVFADMASRPEKRHLMFKLAAVMGIELTKAEIPTGWLERVLEGLLSDARLEKGGKQGVVWTPVQAKPPGQHADTLHYAARGEEEGTTINKASFLKLTTERRKKDAEMRERLANATRFLDRLSKPRREGVQEVRQQRREEISAGAKPKNQRVVRQVVLVYPAVKGKEVGSRSARSPSNVAREREAKSQGARYGGGIHLADRMITELEGDRSLYAIARTTEMREAIRRSHDLRMLGKNEATQQLQRGQWKHWVRFCEAQGICPVRDDHEANSGRDRIGHMREVELLNSALCFYMGVAKGRGRDAALPKAGMNWLRGIRRVHEQMMPRVVMVPMKSVQECYNGLMRQYQLKWTVAPTLPVRKEPLTNADITRLVNLWWDPANDRAKVGKFVIRTGSAVTVVLGCLWLLLLDSGMRLAELTSNKWDVTCCSRANVSFMIGGTIHRAPSRLKLLGMRNGDYAIVTPPPSKKDRYGNVWGCKPIWLDFREGDRGCAARALRELELVLPVDEARRANTPLFVDEAGRCLKGNFVRRVFKDSMLTFKTDKDVKKFSTHSFRITLGCKLKAAGCSDSEIMAMCRWQSLKSLEIYCRLTPEEYARMLRLARGADAKSIQVTSLPDLGEQLDAEQQGEDDDEGS